MNPESDGGLPDGRIEREVGARTRSNDDSYPLTPSKSLGGPSARKQQYQPETTNNVKPITIYRQLFLHQRPAGESEFRRRPPSA
jgi:hypothetical protein